MNEEFQFIGWMIVNVVIFLLGVVVGFLSRNDGDGKPKGRGRR
jgi:hypothetical protein